MTNNEGEQIRNQIALRRRRHAELLDEITATLKGIQNQQTYCGTLGHELRPLFKSTNICNYCGALVPKPLESAENKP